MENKTKITTDLLKKHGFIESFNGDHWLDLQTHYLNMIFMDGYWYPTVVEPSESSSDEPQTVSMNRVQYFEEIQNIAVVVTGSEIKTK